MHYKIDTKEKFTVLSLLDPNLSSNLVPELAQIIAKIGAKAPKNLVLNLGQVAHWELPVIAQLADGQATFYENNTSFVICCLSTKLENAFDELGFLEVLNLTPTVSEASDIVMMEEIERDLGF